jgi:hypothetical protein
MATPPVLPAGPFPSHPDMRTGAYGQIGMNVYRAVEDGLYVIYTADDVALPGRTAG